MNVLVVGYSMVDYCINVAVATLSQLGLRRGAVNHFPDVYPHWLPDVLTRSAVMLGGVPGNAAVGVVAEGGTCRFITRVGDGQDSEAYLSALTLSNVDVVAGNDVAAPIEPCVVLIDDMGERTPVTFPGRKASVRPSDVRPELMNADAVYISAAQLKRPFGQEVFDKTLSLAEALQRPCYINVTDVTCVERFLQTLLAAAVRPNVILVGNEAEMTLLAGADTYELARLRLPHLARSALVTRGSKGAEFLEGDRVHVVDAPNIVVNDTRGAGDRFISSYIVNRTHGMGVVAALRDAASSASALVGGFRPSPAVQISGAGTSEGASFAFN